MRHLFLCSFTIAMLSLASPAMAQYMQQPYQQVYLLNDGQLNQLLAPIALYPDSVLSQILMASTYPADIVDAEIWLQNPDNASLQDDTLVAALQQQPWDPSVKSLIIFPQVIQMMNTYLQWTQQLGNSFIYQQAAILDTIQNLRQQAMTAGTLSSNGEQFVTTRDQAIIIEPADPHNVYLPYYNTGVVYGGWNYPQYPPYSLQTVNSDIGSSVVYGSGVIVVNSFGNWSRPDWHNHQLVITKRHYIGWDGNQTGTNPGTWKHDPQHHPLATPPANNVAPPVNNIQQPPQLVIQPVESPHPTQLPVLNTMPVRQIQQPAQQQIGNPGRIQQPVTNQPATPRNNVTVPSVPAATVQPTTQDPNKKNNQYNSAY